MMEQLQDNKVLSLSTRKWSKNYENFNFFKFMFFDHFRVDNTNHLVGTILGLLHHWKFQTLDSIFTILGHHYIYEYIVLTEITHWNFLKKVKADNVKENNVAGMRQKDCWPTCRSVCNTVNEINDCCSYPIISVLGMHLNIKHGSPIRAFYFSLRWDFPVEKGQTSLSMLSTLMDIFFSFTFF